MFHILLVFSLIFIFWSCSPQLPDERLVDVADKVSESPEEALADLDRINYDSLGTDDQYYYDFLTIKARDKAYVTHTDDSLYLCVLDYYSRHNDTSLYPEVLYYGGRVYSDLGDYPTALKYFQNALDCLPVGTHNLSLRGTLLSQTARLLNTLRLYSDAIPYIKESIEIDRKLGDSIKEVSNIQLLGAIYLRAEDYSKAELCFRSALAKSVGMPVCYKAKSSMYLASVKYKTGQIDSAVIYIRNTPALVKPTSRNNALSWAADIYYAAGMMDSAYYYAHELINSDNDLNKEFGYGTLLSPQLWHRLPMDTVKAYLAEYRNLIESSFNRNENDLAVNQQSLYNYQIHERERLKSEKSNLKLKQLLFIGSLVLLVMSVVMLYLKNIDANTRLKLHAALDNIVTLRAVLEKEKAMDNEDNGDGMMRTQYVNGNETTRVLRERLRKELYDLYSSNIGRTTIPQEIINSGTYRKLLSFISKGREIEEGNHLWAEIESMVLGSSPNFKSNLQLLTGGKLTSYDLHTSLLIKCGIQLKDMTVLLNRTKGAIVSRRESLCYRIFDEKLGTKVIDGVIRLL